MVSKQSLVSGGRMTERIFNFSAGPAVLPVAGFGRSAARHVDPSRCRHVSDGDQSSIENL